MTFRLTHLHRVFLNLLLAFAASVAFAAAPTTGQFLFQRKPSSGAFTQFGVTPTTGYVFGWDGTNVVMIDPTAGAVLWGGITGTLSNQTDLQTALNLKQSTAGVLALGGFSSITGTLPLANVGGTTVGGNLLTLANPSAVSFIRVNADNTVTARTAAQTASDIGAATASNNLSFFAATTSAQLAGVISDETGTGSLVFNTSPSLITPVVRANILSFGTILATAATTTDKTVTFPDATGTVALTTSNVATATALATPRAIYGNNFDGTAALTQVIASTYGGTGNGFTKFTGATTAEKTFTLPNASATVLTDNAAVTVAQGGTGRATSTTAYGLLAAGTTATGAQQTLAAGTTSQLLVGGGAAALPVWTTATGTGAPVRATTPTMVTPILGVATATSINGVSLVTSNAAGISLDGNDLFLHDGSFDFYATLGSISLNFNGSTFNVSDVSLSVGLNVNGADKLELTTVGDTHVTLPITGTIAARITATATLNFPSTAAGAKSDLTVSLTGAVDGDAVCLGVPNGSIVANGVFTAWVSAANTVTVRFTNTNLVTALDPASGSFKVTIVQ